MENIFEKGNKITTNRRNCFEVIDVNETQVVCKDLLTDDFSVFDKTEHKFEITNLKLILELLMKEIIEETEITIEELRNNNSKRVSILTYRGEGDPVKHLDDMINQYTNGEKYWEFIDINMDNPWTRIIVFGEL